MNSIKPDPADIPLTSKEVDRVLLRNELSDEDIKRLWDGNSDSTVKEAARIALYWHHRLQHAPLLTLRRLSMRGCIPACI